MDETSPSLLVRVRDTGDDDAWEQFFKLYSPLVFTFATEKGCDSEMASEVLQESMVCLMRVMPDFSYDKARGKFRSFLCRLVSARIGDAFRRQKRQPPLLAGDNVNRELAEVVDPNGGPTDREWDRHWERNLVRVALERAQERVSPLTYRSFDMVARQGMKARNVACQLGIKPNAVYQHKARVAELVREEVELLKRELGE